MAATERDRLRAELFEKRAIVANPLIVDEDRDRAAARAREIEEQLRRARPIAA
jgi:hypothetical protein